MSVDQADDEAAIRALIDRWSRAVRDQDLVGIRADHDDDILMFDVPPPFQSRGADAYMTTWDLFFSTAERPIRFDFTDIAVTVGGDAAFSTAIGHCVTITPAGRREPVDFRLTMGLKKIEGRWRVLHEHHSVPAE